MRELQLSSGDINKTFEDIEALSIGCKYRDCTHNTEPGCTVKEAIENGNLSIERFESYRKLQKEMNYLGLKSRQVEQQKIKNMFGSVGKMKQAMDYVKDKNKHR
jgi:ribosome biogenesis GTPase